MIPPHEIIVDNFAGGGGASTGIELALGRSPEVAVNHDPEAVAMHTTNHPDTHHLCGNVWEYDPREVAQGRPVGLLWASPDCKHFSKAKGGAPSRSTKIRALAWVVVRWARTVRPRVIILENVEEFLTWGPLLDDGSLCSRRKGKTFRAWVSAIRREGYQVEWRQLRACDYGAPTTRKRLFIIARCDGAPIVWPEPTHGEGLDLFTLRAPYRTAAECIDWSLPVRSIFGRKKPLAEATLKRIALGIERFVTGKTPPFIVGGKAHALIQTGYGERDGQTPRVLDLGRPMGTIVAGGAKQALVAVFLAKNYGGNGTPGSDVRRPFDTITCKDHHSLVEVRLENDDGWTRRRDEDGSGGRAGGAGGRDGVEAPQPEQDALQGAAARRGEVEARVPAGRRVVRGEAEHGLGAPARVDRAAGPGTERDGPESHRRRQEQQQPVEPRGGDQVGELEARVRYGASQEDGRSARAFDGGSRASRTRNVVPRDRQDAARLADDGVSRGEAVRRFLNEHGLPALVTVAGEAYHIVDIGMRMLTPRELFLGQGFPSDYVIDPVFQGKRLSVEAQVRMAGNSVSPPMAAALVAANYGVRQRAAA